ncbi:acyltransferase [Escherichia coli]|uniref:acyltransferase family protein n=1 Tax=Escherichia coli TaxID=562 RepID=UPI000BE4BE04|nr:acyltransferase family protein [Escherichia coli]MBC0561338.1 acyltransferase [Escherichia coli]
MELKYRPEIDGLRTLAVLPVIFFHAGVQWIPGGFLGVDVFFVISGFLITSILLKECSNGTFTFSGFYERRVRRIAPALILMTSVTFIISLFVMVPYDLKNLGQSVVATIFSANNILLYLTSGYWSTASEFKPLYHTWSLAVEEQYYLVAPIIIYIIYSINHNKLIKNSFIFMLLLSIASFLFAAIETTHNREFSFLMLPSRAWEIALGGIAAIAHSKIKRKSNALSFIGFLLIIFSYFLVRGKISHPGLETLMPVIGTCLFLMHANSHKGVGKIMSIKPMVLCGMISYSLYLWHQPVFAFIRLNSQFEPSTIYFIVSIPFIFIISFASYFFVEKPFRNKKKTSTKKIVSCAIASSLVLSISGWLMHKTYGLQNIRPELAYGGNPQEYVDSPKRLKNIDFSDNGKKILIMGNSYARDIINVISTKLNLDDLNIVYFEGNCYESINNSNKLDYYLKDANIIIYSDNWGGEEYNNSVEKLKYCYDNVKLASNAKVYMVGTKNFGYNNNFATNLSKNDRILAKTYPLSKYLQFNNDAKLELGNDYIDVFSLIQDENGMVNVFDGNGKFLSYDTNHLTKYGASYLGDILSKKTDLFHSLK